VTSLLVSVPVTGDATGTPAVMVKTVSSVHVDVVKMRLGPTLPLLLEIGATTTPLEVGPTIGMTVVGAEGTVYAESDAEMGPTALLEGTVLLTLTTTVLLPYTEAEMGEAEMGEAEMGEAEMGEAEMGKAPLDAGVTLLLPTMTVGRDVPTDAEALMGEATLEDGATEEFDGARVGV